MAARGTTASRPGTGTAPPPEAPAHGMAEFVLRPYEEYGHSWLCRQVPHRFNGQPALLSHSFPGSGDYQRVAMEALEPFGSRVRGADMRLQDLDWAGIVETVLGRVLVPQPGRAPPPRPRRVPYEAELDFSKHVIANAPPSLAQARDYMERVTGFAVPEDRQQAFGAWVMDCLLTEANVRAGGRSTVQYLAVLNSIYRRVAMVAAGVTSAPEGAPYWHGSMDVGDANDHRIGNVYESIAGVWFLQRDYGRILDFLCFIIDIQARVLDSHPMPERLRGSESLVWGGPLPAALLAYRGYCRIADPDFARQRVHEARDEEQQLALR